MERYEETQAWINKLLREGLITREEAEAYFKNQLAPE
jgi:hypothetical protein